LWKTFFEILEIMAKKNRDGSAAYGPSGENLARISENFADII